MLFRKLLPVFPVFFLSIFGTAQDTIFIQRHSFDSPVRNVCKAGNEIFVKTGKGMYHLKEGKWEIFKNDFTKPFVFFENDFFEADFLPNKYIFDASGMADLIPQHSLSAATVAQIERGFFLAVAGSLYEYSVNSDYSNTYKRMSIRDIYFDSALKVVSTYSGIYINDTIVAKSPRHSNGAMGRVGNSLYLCSDQLLEFQRPDSFRVILSGENEFAGHSRKVLEFKGLMYSLNTKSINFFDSGMKMKPIHQGYEYYDMEVAQGRLLFCTQSGQIFIFDGSKTTLLAQLNTRIRDIYVESGVVYLSTDKGVYTLKNLDPSTLTQLTNTTSTVMVLADRFKNIWISTENGLFVKPDKTKELISYIPNVEFNRGALAYHNDSIYAGSIEGLYVLDTYHAMKNVIPVKLSLIQLEKKNNRNNLLLFSFLTITLVSISWFGYQAYRRSSLKLDIPHRENQPKLNLDNLEKIIREHHIQTVEGLAEYFKTSTVQLNREFKVFNTTPGRFLRDVKIRLAKELLSEQTPMEEVVRLTGYSASFLHKELKKDIPAS